MSSILAALREQPNEVTGVLTDNDDPHDPKALADNSPYSDVNISCARLCRVDLFYVYNEPCSLLQSSHNIFIHK